MDKKTKKSIIVLRILGPIILIAAIALIVFGFTNIEEESWFFIPIGMFTLFIGAVLSMFGYMNAINSFVSNANKEVRNQVISESASAAKNGFEGSYCPHCGNVVDKDANFCDNCGKPLVVLCPSCGVENDSDAKFCKNCGAKLK